jgi:hypothetical protein
MLLVLPAFGSESQMHILRQFSFEKCAISFPKIIFCCFLHKKTSKNENGSVCCISVCYVHCGHSFLLQFLQIANRNAKSQLTDNQKDMPIFFAFLHFCNFLVSKQTNRGDGLHLIKLTNIG